MPYQGPNEGFRREVKKAAIKVLKEYNKDHCPSCLEIVTPDEYEKHAESCIELRSDVASNM